MVNFARANPNDPLIFEAVKEACGPYAFDVLRLIERGELAAWRCVYGAFVTRTIETARGRECEVVAFKGKNGREAFKVLCERLKQNNIDFMAFSSRRPAVARLYGLGDPAEYRYEVDLNG